MSKKLCKKLCGFLFWKNYQGRVRILIKTRLKINFDRFTMEKMSNFIFNRILMSIRTRPKWFFILEKNLSGFLFWKNYQVVFLIGMNEVRFGWLAGWRPEISELERDRDFRFFAIASVDWKLHHYKNFEPGPPLCPGTLGAKLLCE